MPREDDVKLHVESETEFKPQIKKRRILHLASAHITRAYAMVYECFPLCRCPTQQRSLAGQATCLLHP